MDPGLQVGDVSICELTLGRSWDELTRIPPAPALPIHNLPLQFLPSIPPGELGKGLRAEVAVPGAGRLQKGAVAGSGALRRVGLIYDTRRTFDRNVMAGLAAWLREQQGYCLHIADNSLPGPGSWDVDGIIANLDDPAVARAVAASGLPAVGFGAGYLGHGRRGHATQASVPYLFPNNTSIANLAADHFLACGLRNFGYSGYSSTGPAGWSGARQDAFVLRIQERGFKCHLAPKQAGQSGTSTGVRLTAWLRSLPKPAGIMASDDTQARRILEICRDCGIDVPEELAVIGVNNDELLCGLGLTALTSIDPGTVQLGFRAAELLDGIMRGRQPKDLITAIEPVGIVTRQSTASTAVRDLIVEKAIAVIHAGISEGVRVRDVARAVAMSRSSLETRFKKEFGNSIRGVIRTVQMAKAKRLVADSDLPLKQVAVSSGFRSVQHMTTLFRQAFGNPPAVYRHIARLRDGSAGAARICNS